MPPQLAARFTLGECAVLSVVAQEVARHGHCELAVGHIAALAGVGCTLVRNAIREARRLGIVAVEARRIGYDRNRPNVVTIVSDLWTTWLRMRARKVSQVAIVSGGGGSVRFVQPTRYKNIPYPETDRHVGRKKGIREGKSQDRCQCS